MAWFRGKRSRSTAPRGGAGNFVSVCGGFKFSHLIPPLNLQALRRPQIGELGEQISVSPTLSSVSSPFVGLPERHQRASS